MEYNERQYGIYNWSPLSDRKQFYDCDPEDI